MQILSTNVSVMVIGSMPAAYSVCVCVCGQVCVNRCIGVLLIDKIDSVFTDK